MLDTAMILAAGRGERMRPLTDTLPKPLLEAGGHALIAYHVEALRRAGFRRLVINHAWLGDKIVAAVNALDNGNLEILFSDEGDSALETGGGIFKALPLLGQQPFVVVNADIWCDYPLSGLPGTLSGLAHLVMVDNPPQHSQGDFAMRNGKLLERGNNRYTFSGIGVYRAELFNGCEQGAFPLAPLLRKAMQEGSVSGEYYSGNWFDIGTPERLKELDAWLEKNKF